MRYAFHILLILTGLGFGTLSSCNNSDFKQTRAEMLERQRQRKEEYKAKKEAEEKEKEQARIEAEALAEARVKAEQEAEQKADSSQSVVIAYPQDSILLQFERRPCFGRCPVYKIKVFESGYATYEGVNFVDRMGYYQGRMTPSQLAEIYTLVASKGYFDLEDEYDNPRVTDLPSMIFRVKAMGKDKRIVARYDFPDALKEMASQIDEMIENTKWIPAQI